MAAEASPTVLVASDDGALLDDIVRYLDQIPSWKLVTCSGSAPSALNALEAHLPDAALVSDGLAVELSAGLGAGRLSHATLVVVGWAESTEGLRAALRLGARSFVTWPADRQSLQGLVERNRATRPAARKAPGNLYSVWSPKGGSGASTVAAHLAGCLAGLGAECILADLDFGHADQRLILGLEDHSKHLGDLVRMGSELSANIIDEVAAAHPLGFKAVLAPPEPSEDQIKPADLATIVSAIREGCEVVIADLPSGLNEAALAVLDQSSAAYLVLTADVLCLRRAQDALKVIRAGGSEVPRLEVIVNQTGHGAVSSRDVENVLGLPVARQIKAEMDIYQAANRGRLSDTGKRALNKLARAMLKSARTTAPNQPGAKWR